MPGHEASATRPVHPAQHMLAQSTWIHECRPSLSGFPGVHGCGRVSRGTPVRITDRDSASHPFPARKLIVVSSGPSRCWPVRGSPNSPENHRSCRSRAILQPGPATSPSSTQSEPPVSEPTNPRIPTGSHTYSPRRARPSAARFPLASRSRPHHRRPFRCLHHPAIRFPRHHERSRRDRQRTLQSWPARSTGSKPNSTTRPGSNPPPRRTAPKNGPTPTCPPPFVQPHRHPTLRQPTQRFRWGSRMRYHAGIPGSSRLHTPPITHPPFHVKRDSPRG